MQTMDNIDRQARQGSVAAIIQILNERFADSQIRIRAVLDQGILQLLCEAPTPEQIPQAEIVNRVKTTLEEINPRGIGKVKVNGRVVQEEQLLWLDAIKRDPKNQLLWSELISIKTTNPIARLWQDWQTPRQRNPFAEVQQPRNRQVIQGAFWRGLLGGASLCLFLLVMGWAFKDWLGIELSQRVQPDTGVATPQPPPDQDPFVQAVRLAQSAADDGQTANTTAQWLELAARWQRAADLMAEVPPSDDRYGTAQQRVDAYRKNSALALDASKAENQPQETAPASPQPEQPSPTGSPGE